ncbi:hypothetical protein Ddye_024044 [Dipteronia dyeriana]|uniref:Uncharacterized protein n=1 Tax=Dipteronia dyeriana TaxID=168575 RepID=A0AAD9TU77_9ROSI|nr:hypothetical protein Ddye_024044 [Dipteronia dyeriana]
MVTSITSIGDQSWLTDTGANAHVTGNATNLASSKEYHGACNVDGVIGGAV